jgi:hypothetical protein
VVVVVASEGLVEQVQRWAGPVGYPQQPQTDLAVKELPVQLRYPLQEMLKMAAVQARV